MRTGGILGGDGLMPNVSALILLSACSVSDPPSPPIFGDPKQPNEAGEQAETHAVVARRPNGAVNIVVGHRFTGPSFINNNSASPLDIKYDESLPGDVSFRRGASIGGWSYSATGAVWQAPGKVYPQFVWGQPVAILWSDPALAVGRTNQSLVAYANLAVSKQAFDAVAGASQNELPGWPTNLTTPDGINLVDSICVALSFDGGVQFGDLVCAREPDIGDAGTDQTTTAIGAGDRVYVAVDDWAPSSPPFGGGGRILLYELHYTGQPTPTLEKLAVDPDMDGYSRGPELRRDQSGAVWLSAMNPAGTVRLCQVLGGGCSYVGQVTADARLFASLPAGVVTDKELRSGVSADFAVNRTQLAGSTVREFVFVYSRLDPDTSRPYVGATRCFRFGLSGDLGCQDIDAWGTQKRTGYQVQPRIELVDKSAAQDGSGADWRYAFYEFGRNEIGTGRAQVTLATLFGTLPNPAEPKVAFAPLPGADPEVCPAYYSWADAHYWGDYFGLVAVPPVPGNANWRHLAVYSSDEQRGCEPSHPLQGRNLHVVAWGWTD